MLFLLPKKHIDEPITKVVAAIIYMKQAHA
jgi:hypothetical protein